MLNKSCWETPAKDRHRYLQTHTLSGPYALHVKVQKHAKKYNLKKERELRKENIFMLWCLHIVDVFFSAVTPQWYAVEWRVSSARWQQTPWAPTKRPCKTSAVPCYGWRRRTAYISGEFTSILTFSVQLNGLLILFSMVELQNSYVDNFIAQH